MDEKVVYMFKAEICYEDCNNKIKNKTVHGAIQATSFTNATIQLEEYYGDELESISLTCLDYGLITFPEDLVPQIQKHMEENWGL